jgi:hypothetical protein
VQRTQEPSGAPQGALAQRGLSWCGLEAGEEAEDGARTGSAARTPAGTARGGEAEDGEECISLLGLSD